MFLTLFRLITSSLFPVFFAVLFYHFEKKTKFKTVSYWKKQIIIGVVFGLISVLATDFGIEVSVKELNKSATLNIRDAAPLTAGLIFGGPSGIIAGLIGGIHRFVSVYYNPNIGKYSQIACSIATAFAGFFAAVCRKYMFREKKPSWIYGLIIGITVEVLHMVILFLTHMDDIYTAFLIVKKCALPMIAFNALSVAVSLWVIAYMGKEKISVKSDKKEISQIFQFFLTICIVIAFVATCLFSFILQTNIAKSNVESLLLLNIDDVNTDINEAIEAGENVEERISLVVNNRHIGQGGAVLICDKSFNVKIASDNVGEYFFEGQKITENDVEDGKFFKAEYSGQKCYCMYKTNGDYITLALMPVEEGLLSRDIAVYIIAFMEVLVFATLFVNVYFLIKRLVVDNIHKVNDSLAKITCGNLNEKVEVRDNLEFESLSDDINQTVLTLKHYIAEAEARINKELEFARQIQKSVLPNVILSFKDRKDFSVFATMNAAKEVGGDFYDCYLVGENTLVFMVADVSGKGIPGAMCMMRSKTLIKDLVERGISVEEAFTLANQKLCKNNEAGMFVTAWIGSLDLTTKKLSFVNAGHNPPLIKKANGKFEYLRTRPNFILAGMDGVKYRKQELDLNDGDEIFLYTDGVTEATNINKELYGEERLLNLLNKKGVASPEDLCTDLKEDIDKFAGEAEQFDDITMLCVKLDGNDDFVSTCDEKSMSSALSYIESKAEQLDVDFKLANKLQISVDEIYSNILQYSGAKNVRISLKKVDDKVVLKFVDDGRPYDPTKEEEPDITLSAEERDIGGLGIFMVKKFASKLEYDYTDKLNVLTVWF